MRHAWLPEEWPEQQFDLIVLSEVAYYLDEAALDLLAERILASMLPNAVLSACHWRERIGGCAMSGDEVNRRLADRLALPHLAGYSDDDLRLDVWSLDCRSVAEREGFKSARS